MGKNRYKGVDVYVSKLKSGTKFRTNNDHFEEELIIKNGVPKVVVGSVGSYAVSDTFILNITTDSEIPKSAYVYKSVYYAQEIKRESRKLAELANMIENELLDDGKLRKVKISLKNSAENLDTLFLKFYEMKKEEHVL